MIDFRSELLIIRLVSVAFHIEVVYGGGWRELDGEELSPPCNEELLQLAVKILDKS